MLTIKLKDLDITLVNYATDGRNCKNSFCEITSMKVNNSNVILADYVK